MHATVLADVVMLARGGGAVRGHVWDRATQLQCGRAHATGRHVHQHVIAWAYTRHVEQHVVSRDVHDGQRGCDLERSLVRDAKGVMRRDTHRVCLPPEVWSREHAIAHGQTRDRSAEPIDHARTLVAHHGRELRCVRIQSLSRHHVGEIQTRRAHAHPHLVGLRFRVGRLADLEALRATVFFVPDRAHAMGPLSCVSPERIHPN